MVLVGYGGSGGGLCLCVLQLLHAPLQTFPHHVPGVVGGGAGWKLHTAHFSFTNTNKSTQLLLNLDKLIPDLLTSTLRRGTVTMKKGKGVLY